MNMEVRRLSGGEQSRLLIARLMLKEANVLVLDEPTNDLDMATLQVWEECLLEFPGAVLLVTHDRYFLDQVANRLFAFGEPDTSVSGQIVPFADLEQWERSYIDGIESKREREKKKDAKIAAPGPTSVKKKLSYKERYELDHMEESIHQAEAKLKELKNESLSPEVTSNASRLTELIPKIEELEAKIDQLYSRWSELENK